jgi:hypothetical protein
MTAVSQTVVVPEAALFGALSAASASQIDSFIELPLAQRIS